MSDFISREKAVGALKNAKVHVTGMKLGKTILSEYSKQVRDGYVDVLENVPAEDVATIHYATWVCLGKTSHGTPIRMCSNCEIAKAGKPKSNFCPDCGAVMRKDNILDDGQESFEL